MGYAGSEKSELSTRHLGALDRHVTYPIALSISARSYLNGHNRIWEAERYRPPHLIRHHAPE
jgi:hypothetical protein